MAPIHIDRPAKRAELRTPGEPAAPAGSLGQLETLARALSGLAEGGPAVLAGRAGAGVRRQIGAAVPTLVDAASVLHQLDAPALAGRQALDQVHGALLRLGPAAGRHAAQLAAAIAASDGNLLASLGRGVTPADPDLGAVLRYIAGAAATPALRRAAAAALGGHDGVDAVAVVPRGRVAAGPPAALPEPLAVLRKARSTELTAAQRAAMLAYLRARGEPNEVVAELAEAMRPQPGGKPGIHFSVLEGPDGAIAYTRALAQGSYGRFHRGRELRTGAPCAVKVLRMAARQAPGKQPKTQLTEPEGRDSELEIMRRVGSRLYTGRTFARAGKSYIVMPEFAGDLHELATTQARPGRTALARQAMVQLGEQLARFHRAGVVHRDVKEENVLFAADGALELADMGLAAVLGGADYGADSYVGTVGYMPPEAILTDRVGTAMDIYGLGSLFLALCTGRRPIDALGSADEDPDAHALVGAFRDFARAVAALPRRPDGLIDTDALRRRRDAFVAHLAGLWSQGPEVASFVLDRMLHVEPRRRPRAAEVARFFAGLPGQAGTAAVARGAAATYLAAAGRRAERAVQDAGLDAYVHILTHADAPPAARGGVPPLFV